MTQFRTWTWADMNKPPSEALEIGQKEALMELLNMTMEQVNAFVDAERPEEDMASCRNEES